MERFLSIKTWAPSRSQWKVDRYPFPRFPGSQSNLVAFKPFCSSYFAILLLLLEVGGKKVGAKMEKQVVLFIFTLLTFNVACV